MRTRFPHRAVAVVAVAAAAAVGGGLLAACGPAPATSARAPSAGRSPSSRPSVVVPPANGLVPAHRGLTDRLVLQRTRVTAGGEIKGTLVVINTSHVPVSLTHGCRPDYVVVLTSRRFPPDVTFTSACSGASFIIRPGENRQAVTVPTTFPNCVRTARLATPQHPACLPGRHGGAPPLRRAGMKLSWSVPGCRCPLPRRCSSASVPLRPASR